MNKINLWFKDKYNLFIKSGIYGEDYIKILNQSKIVFNHSASGTINYRVFETLGVGALALYEESNQCIKEIFKDKEHIVLYNEDNLKDIIEYYLNNDKERERIALNGYNLVKEYTAKKQVEKFLNFINNVDLTKIKQKKAISLSKYYNSLACHYLCKIGILSNDIIINLYKKELDWKVFLSKVINLIKNILKKFIVI